MLRPCYRRAAPDGIPGYWEDADPLPQQPGEMIQNERVTLSLDEIRAVPKVLLHDHLDGGLRTSTIVELAEEIGYGELPICMAKTQNSLSDNPKLLGRPRGYTLTVRDIEIAAGAGFVVALTGEIVRMPGLPERPAADRIDVDESGEIRGLT